jgi:ABC-type microcin C transport system permease subunit YejE
VTVAASSLALSLGLTAGIAVFGTLAGAFVGMWSTGRTERHRQAFERAQAAKSERAQAMKTAGARKG